MVNSKIDIIDFIVSEERKKADAFQAQNNENLTLLNEVNIFKENDPITGIWKKENLKPIFKASHPILMGYKTFFEMLTSKQKFNTSSFPLIDSNGEKYYFINDNRKNGSTGFKLVWFLGLDEIINAYMWNMFAFKIDFEKLYHEVNK